MKYNRRKLLEMMGAGAVGLTLPSFRRSPAYDSMPENLTILFQGDSITDAGRTRGQYYANNNAGMGGGYVKHIATELLGLHPGHNLKIYNRGISGNKVHQLANRWDEDCLQIQPDVLSILIGVNDFWHTVSYNYDGDVQTYEDDYRRLIERTLNALPAVKIIIGEPFVLYDGTAIDKDQWRISFPSYQAVARKIAGEFNAEFIGYQEVFEKALALAGTEYWCPDGVHPSMAGSYLMANAWSEAFYKLTE
jgi:lysophospholipase L1-like esterase